MMIAVDETPHPVSAARAVRAVGYRLARLSDGKISPLPSSSWTIKKDVVAHLKVRQQCTIAHTEAALADREIGHS